MIGVPQLPTLEDVIKHVENLKNVPIALRESQAQYALRRINELDAIKPLDSMVASGLRLQCLQRLGEVKRWRQSKQT